jgi:hypothetical protein
MVTRRWPIAKADGKAAVLLLLVLLLSRPLLLLRVRLLLLPLNTRLLCLVTSLPMVALLLPLTSSTDADFMLVAVFSFGAAAVFAAADFPAASTRALAAAIKDGVERLAANMPGVMGTVVVVAAALGALL